MSNDDATDPWSRDVPPSPPPASFDFPSELTRSTDRNDGAITSAVSEQPRRSGVGEHLDVPPPRRWTVPIVAAASVVALIVGGVAIGSRSDPAVDTSDAPTTDTGASDAPGTTAPALERTTTAPPSTTRPPAAPRTTPLPTVPPPPPEWVDGQIILPERIAQLGESIELVALTARGKVIRIDIADGTTSTFDLDRRQPGSTLHLGETTMLIANNNGNTSGPTLLPADGDPIEVDIDGSGGVNVIGVGPGADEFTAFVWSSTSGAERSVVIGADGSVEDYDIDDIAPWELGPFAPTGERWVSDAGGVYLQSSDGTARRVSTGRLITNSASKLLVRECDEQRTCGSFVIDIATEERVPAQTPDDFTFWDAPIQQSALSPDGKTLLVVFWDEREGAMLDLATGEQTEVSMVSNDSYGNSTLAWSPDSTGYFTIDAGEAVFVDRTTGETTSLDIEFDDNDTFSDVKIRAAP